MSAGAIILTPSIKSASYPQFDCDENVDNIKNFNSLGLVNFEFFPHYKNSERYNEELIYQSKNTSNPIYAARDGSGIIEKDEEIIFYGDIWEFNKKNKLILT